MPMVLTSASTGSYYHHRHHHHHHHRSHHHHPPEDLLPASWESLGQQQQQQQQPQVPADRDQANKPFPVNEGQAAGQLTGSPLLDMGAGKLVTLIKKCLSRERDGAGNNNNSSSSSSCSSSRSSTSKQDKPKSCRGGDSEQDRTRPSSSLGCYSLDSPPALGSSGFRPANSAFCDSPCNTRSKQGFSYPPSHSAMQQVVYVQQQQQQKSELDVERLREHQRRLKSVEVDTKLNYPTSVCRSKDGEEGYANSQRQLQFSNCNRDSMRNCIVPPPNRTLPQSESPLPNRSHSVGVLDRHSKLGSRTAPSLSPTAIQRSHTMSAATDNNNRLGNLNFNFTQGGSGGGSGGGGSGSASHGTPRLGAPHGSNNPASLSLGVNAATGGSGTRRTVRLTSSPAAIGRSRHTSSTSSYHSNTSNLSVGSTSPAFDSPPEYASEV